jgi:uncharacterized protein
MGRLLVLIVLVVFAVWFVRRALSRLQPGDKPLVKEGELVRCAHCGVHLPRSEARQAEGILYCSEEHARLGKR